MIKTIDRNGLVTLESDRIPVPHAFTTRRGGVSEGAFANLNLALGQSGDCMENVEENLRILARGVGFDESKLVMTMQIHSSTVRAVTESDCRGLYHRNYPACDALITATPGLALLVFTADCTPLLLYDPATGAVGAVHAGWRGTAADIAGEAVRAMVREYGTRPENIVAAIGPNIGQCCFQTDADVPQAMREAFGTAAEEYIRPDGKKFYVDLKGMNRLALERAGVEKTDISDACTCCAPELFWSHRYTHGLRGSQGAVILCQGRES